MSDYRERACTCHPDEAPKPCPQRYAYSECVLAAEVERLRSLLRPFVNMVVEPEDFAAARRELELEISVTLNQRLVALANSLGGKDEDEIMAAVAEIKRLQAEVKRLLGLCKDKTVLLEEAYAKIERLTDAFHENC